MVNLQIENTMDFEQTLMYGQYKKDLARFSRSLASSRSRGAKPISLIRESSFFRAISGCFGFIWKYTLGIIDEDWPFLALLGITMAIISFTLDFFVLQCHQTRVLLYDQLFTYNIVIRYFGWITFPVLLLVFATGVVGIISPQATGSGIPEMKTILRGVILHEYLSFRTLVAKLIGLACILGSGLPFGKEGPFVHTCSMVATILSKVIGSFQHVYDRDARTTEMLAVACAVGVATTFYSPIGGVLFSVEVTTDFFAIRSYWRGFFSACSAATFWRLLTVFFRKEAALTSLFKTNFRTDFPFDPQELLVFAFIGVACGFGGAFYVRCHRWLVHYIRNQKTLNAFLKKNRFVYPTVVTLLLMSISFPPFMGQYMASFLSNPQTFKELFSNITWDVHGSNDSKHLTMVQHWSTNHTSIYTNLIITIFNTFWMSILASTIPVPHGLFIPIFKIGATFGRLVGEIMAACFPDGISFSGYTIPIVPGGYSVVGAAAFTGAVTHTISITVIVFEMTGQMSHMIPVILSVLISNAISQKLELSIYDSVIQIKKLPFLPPIMVANSLAHNIFVDDIMVRNLVFVWLKNFTYRDIVNLLSNNPEIRTFPLVDNCKNMILLGSVQRDELERIVDCLLCRERRLQEVVRKNSLQEYALGIETESDEDSIQFITPFMDYEQIPSPTNKSRFNVSLVSSNDYEDKRINQSAIDRRSPVKPKSILKQTFTITTYSPHSTINTNSSIRKDSRLRQVFENIFQKSLHLEDAHPNPLKQSAESMTTKPPIIERSVQLPRERVIDMTAEEQHKWEEEQLNTVVDFNDCCIDPAPFQLVERTTIYKVHLFFSMLSLSRAYVTSVGRLIGLVDLADLKNGIDKLNQGLLQPHEDSEEANNYLYNIEFDPHHEDTLTSFTEVMEINNQSR
ncbi:chloride channel protein 2-like [Dermatophagoides farinae]|uniref:Chloride channel protein 2-like n=2 Tax=Dermatophagoides farinae TaxID=6954 RepID=A0A9D4P021_DERFA|nr:chloride channel protein 2-like [Dermatophagoides farinae]